jgi:hypothetical protein
MGTCAGSTFYATDRLQIEGGMRMRMFTVAAALAALGSAAGASAQDRTADNPLVSNLVGCRGQADDQARLRCYDAAAAALAEATSAGAVVVIDREEVRRTRRALFGFNLPRLPFFGGDNSQQEEEPSEIEGRIESARSAGYGKWVIELEDGALWQTTEADTRLGAPRIGQPVRIRKAALGSYMISVDRQRSVRAMRVR